MLRRFSNSFNDVVLSAVFWLLLSFFFHRLMKKMRNCGNWSRRSQNWKINTNKPSLRWDMQMWIVIILSSFYWNSKTSPYGNPVNTAILSLARIKPHAAIFLISSIYSVTPMIPPHLRALVVDGLTRFRCSLFTILDLVVPEAWANCSCLFLRFRLWHLKVQWPGWLRENRKTVLHAHDTTSKKHRVYLKYSFCWVKKQKQHKTMAIYLLIVWALFPFCVGKGNGRRLRTCQWKCYPDVNDQQDPLPITTFFHFFPFFLFYCLFICCCFLVCLKVSHREEALQRLQVQQKDFVEEVSPYF